MYTKRCYEELMVVLASLAAAERSPCRAAIGMASWVDDVLKWAHGGVMRFARHEML